MARVLIVGIGGVGGYIGGMLAREFAGNNEVCISFFARGEHALIIKRDGLRVVDHDVDFVARPYQVIIEASELKPVDYIILCTKSYSLGEVLWQLKPAIAGHTVILPLLNGIAHHEVIRDMYPSNLVLDGCIHMVSRVAGPAKVQNFGNKPHLFFGDSRPGEDQEDLHRLAKIFTQAGLLNTLTDDISRIVWEKFVFISALATCTSYYNRTVGQVVEHADSQQTMRLLLQEIFDVAAAKDIRLSSEFKDGLMKRLETISYDSTTSMHSDFINHKPNTELETLTGYVISEGRKSGVATPVYQMAYESLKNH